MGNKVLFVRLSERAVSAAEMIERLNDSFCKKESRYYNTSTGDKAEMDRVDIGETVLFVAILHSGKLITNAYLGNGEVTAYKTQKNIKYYITATLPVFVNNKMQRKVPEKCSGKPARMRMISAGV